MKLVEALERKYLLFHYDNEQISMAFEFNQLQEKEDRLYSTYFIGTYSNPKPILDVQLGCLINTTAINSSRSGLERENEKEPLILSKIKDKCKITISVLCQLILDEKDPKNEKIYTDILCQFLYKYRFYCSKESGEVVPDSIFEGKSEEISKTISNWRLNEKKYILYKEDGIKDNKVIINKPPNSDDKNITDLLSVYKQYFYKISEHNTDIIMYEDCEYKQLTNGIKKLCEFVFSDPTETWLHDLKLPFLKTIKSLIIRRIGGINSGK